MHFRLFVALLPALFSFANCFNFPYEQIQLTDKDTVGNVDVKFGSTAGPAASGDCKIFPGDTNWPSETRWAAFNTTLGGALIKTLAPASPCYANQPNYNPTECSTIRSQFSQLAFQMENPNSIMSDWLTGATCPPTTNTNGTCLQGGYPVYVVNATTAKHIQAAVNFARNNQIRLVIKNTGHDWIGRSAGAGALSVWTHHLKTFEYLPSYRIGRYQGRAARVGVALQSFDLFTEMSNNNITVVAPQDQSIGTFGGYMQGGGHSWLGSKYGLMADQVLSVEIVTANGRFITADPTQNQDLFFAVRGGGGSTFGIVTSAVIKAYPAISMSSSPISFSTANTRTTPGLSSDVFWSAVRIYFADLGRIADNKGFVYQFINVGAANNVTTYTLTATYYFPDTSATQAQQLLAPFYSQLAQVGVNLTNPSPTFYPTYSSMFAGRGVNGGAGGQHFIGRLWPRKTLETPDLLDTSMTAIRAFVEEGGYTFHSVAYTPSDTLAGYPGSSNAVNPAFRVGIMHVTGFDSQLAQGDVNWQKQRYERLNSFTQRLRDATPGAGAYMNEADIQEPNWQQSFYGNHWERLSTIKRQQDPSMVFYAHHGVGSEAWEVKTPDGMPTQNGRLCKVGRTPSI
ncbi:FAD/FMN-containing isoamyl alcohol oxidase-like protein MreA [Crepidotus variabilis]|uniref:FAD/FMN-containing isoamyl alcohol oxidase-like protein MreA n=1 Tax=Crepidotus variabilis TaxID=179855 RepID=A0A9P6E7I2_9AGAR|nr:FAD/FMN-containing isoamyl alcohol oxidase-like protein MreA [Crepidotus variabilis]